MPQRTLIAVALTLALAGCSDAPTPTPSEQQPVASAASAPTTPAAPPVDARAAASLAVREGRVVAPAGDNAFEWYLSVREAQPDNTDAVVALIDLMPIADQAARYALESGDVAEATRIVDLMARYDARSETTKAARGRMQDWEREQARQEPAARAAAIVPPPNPLPAPSQAAVPAQQVAAVRGADQDRAATARPVKALPPSPAEPQPQPADAPAPVAAAATPPTPAVTFTPPAVLRQAPAQYPPQAKRQGLEGFVELDLRVDAQGNPEDIQVVRSEPSGVFDKAAVRAVMRWKFEPARRNGQAEAARTRTVIQFRKG